MNNLGFEKPIGARLMSDLRNPLKEVFTGSKDDAVFMIKELSNIKNSFDNLERRIIEKSQ
jgi:hypothetical protein